MTVTKLLSITIAPMVVTNLGMLQRLVLNIRLAVVLQRISVQKVGNYQVVLTIIRWRLPILPGILLMPLLGMALMVATTTMAPPPVSGRVVAIGRLISPVAVMP